MIERKIEKKKKVKNVIASDWRSNGKSFRKSDLESPAQERNTREMYGSFFVVLFLFFVLFRLCSIVISIKATFQISSFSREGGGGKPLLSNTLSTVKAK